ncbi:MAG: TonB-dependent receptor [Ignavibacteria bacterium]|nr:TonB-dependent receptor [Ignavibacteria bacterium]
MLQLGGGLYIKSYGGNYSLNTVSLNGLGAEHTLVLLNGFKMNSSQNNLIDLNTVTKDNIESIEILNNGSSSIYGSEAMGGVVNIITKDNLVNDLSLKLNAQAGSYEQRKIYFGLDKRLNKFNINFSLSKESSLNDYEYYFGYGSEKLLKQRENSDYDLSNYSVTVNYNLSADSRLNLYSNYSDQARSIPGIETGSAPSASVQEDKNWNSVLSYENVLSGLLSFKSQVNYQNNLAGYYDDIITDSYYKNIFLSNLTQLNYVKNNFELAGGYEIDYSTLKSNEVEDNAERVQPGIFLVSKININDIIKIYPSVRYDYISDIKENAVSGMMGLNIKPVKNSSLNFKLNAGNNFAAPTFNELYWKDLGNKDLKPESSLNLDAGLIYGFSYFSENTVEITYSYIDSKNKIIWSPDPNGLWTPENIGRSVSNVLLFELNIGKEFSRDFNTNININYSYTQSTNKSNTPGSESSFGRQIFYIPMELAKCNVSLNYKNTGINLFYTFTGKRFTNFENTEFLRAVDLIEGNIYQNFNFGKINTRLKFEVNNLLNADYQIISGYPMPLRNYKLSLGFEY